MNHPTHIGLPLPHYLPGSDLSQAASRFAAAGAQENGESLDLHTLWRRLWGRKFFILLSTGLCAAVVGVLVFLLPAHYVAHALVLVGSREQQTRSGNVAPRDPALVETYVQILKSPALAAEVVRDLKLYDLPEFNPVLEDEEETGLPSSGFSIRALLAQILPEHQARAGSEVDQTIAAFLKRLNVEPKGTSRVIDVAFDASDPALAATVANKVVDTYIADQAALRADSVTQRADWLHQKVVELQARAQASETEVEKYRDDAGLYRTSTGQPLINKEIEDVRTQLSAAETQRAALEDRLRIARVSGVDVSAAQAGPESASSALGKILDAQIATLQQQLADASATLGPRHPKILALRNEIATLNREKGTQQHGSVKTLEDQLKIATLTEQGIANRLQKLQQNATKLDAAVVGLKAREREAEADHVVLTNFIAQYNETTLARDAIGEEDFHIVSPAATPLTPDRPKKALLIAIAGSLAGFGSCAWALRRNGRTFQSMEEVEALTNERALGLVPSARLAQVSPTGALRQRSTYAKAVRELFAALLMRPGNGSRIILLTSSSPFEGKTTLALSLAALAGLSGHRAILIDADFWKATASNALGLNDGIGLGELLEEKADLSQALLSERSSGFDIIQAGHLSSEPAATAIEYLTDLVVEPLKQRGYEFIIIDAPPVFAVPETILLAAHADAAVLAVRWAKTPRALVQATLKKLRASGALVAGIVLTMVDERRHARFGLQEGYAEAAYFSTESAAYNSWSVAPRASSPHHLRTVSSTRASTSLVPIPGGLSRLLGANRGPASERAGGERLIFPRSREAIVVIGMYERRSADRALERGDMEEFLARMKAVIQLARNRGLDIVHLEAEGGAYPSLNEERLLTLRHAGAFRDSELHHELQENQVNHLFLMGFDSLLSINKIADAALDRGYRVTFISDLIFSAARARARQKLAGYEARGALAISSKEFMRLYAAESARRSRTATRDFREHRTNG